MLRFATLCLGLMLTAVASGRAQTDAKADWSTIAVDAMKTSIYVGSVTLTTSEFHRAGDRYTATYEAKVWPWLFWSETGTIAITVPEAGLDRLRRGERLEFTGEAVSHKNKPRHITGRADRLDAASGKIKVRIGAGDVELIFNGTYRVSGAGSP